MKILNKYFKLDYKNKTYLTTLFSTLITIAFALYNGVLGVIYKSIWNGSICIYYLLLIFTRFMILFVHKKENLKLVPFFIYFNLLVIDISMIAPAVFLLKGAKDYDWGLIPAIAMAAYSFYSLTMSIINLRKSKKTNNILVKQIRLINHTASLMSIIGLQNTMILANSGMTESMLILSTATTFGIIIIAVSITVISFILYVILIHKKRLSN